MAADRLLTEGRFNHTAADLARDIKRARQQLELGQETLLTRCLREYDRLTPSRGPVFVPHALCPPTACPPCLPCQKFWEDCRNSCNATTSAWHSRLADAVQALNSSYAFNLQVMQSQLGMLNAQIRKREGEATTCAKQLVRVAVSMNDTYEAHVMDLRTRLSELESGLERTRVEGETEKKQLSRGWSMCRERHQKSSALLFSCNRRAAMLKMRNQLQRNCSSWAALDRVTLTLNASHQRHVKDLQARVEEMEAGLAQSEEENNRAKSHLSEGWAMCLEEKRLTAVRLDTCNRRSSALERDHRTRNATTHQDRLEAELTSLRAAVNALRERLGACSLSALPAQEREELLQLWRAQWVDQRVRRREERRARREEQRLARKSARKARKRETLRRRAQARHQRRENNQAEQ